MNQITAVNVVKATRRHSGTLLFFHGSGKLFNMIEITSYHIIFIYLL